MYTRVKNSPAKVTIQKLAAENWTFCSKSNSYCTVLQSFKKPHTMWYLLYMCLEENIFEIITDEKEGEKGTLQINPVNYSLCTAKFYYHYSQWFNNIIWQFGDWKILYWLNLPRVPSHEISRPFAHYCKQRVPISMMIVVEFRGGADEIQ